MLTSGFNNKRYASEKLTKQGMLALEAVKKKRSEKDKINAKKERHKQG
jgi:hypothetical protein